MNLSGNTLDSSSNSNNAANAGATLTTDRFGNSNSAYYFGGNDYIATPVLQTELCLFYSFSLV